MSSEPTPPTKKRVVVCTFTPPNPSSFPPLFPSLHIIFAPSSPLSASSAPSSLVGSIGGVGCMTSEELISYSIREGAEGIVHSQFSFYMSESVVNSLPPSMKVIANNGAGYDGFAVSAATERKIWVTNTPSVVNDSTADLAVFLLLAITRKAYESEQLVRQGEWKVRMVDELLGNDPKNKLLGIIGLGGIGKAVATRAQAFGLKIIYYNRNRLSPEEERKYNVQYVSFDELLGTSDYISLHCPLTAETKHLIDRPQFGKMKDGVYLVNTSRGLVVNEEALVEALKSGKVRGAGLDVFEKEPIGDGAKELRSLPNVTLLPHVGTNTYETRIDMARLCFENVNTVLLHNRKPNNAVNNFEL